MAKKSKIAKNEQRKVIDARGIESVVKDLLARGEKI